MAINATIQRQGQDYRKARKNARRETVEQVHDEPVYVEEALEEQIEEPVKVEVKHKPVIDHKKMRNKLKSEKTSSYMNDMLNI